MDPSEQDALIARYVAAYYAFDIQGMVEPLHEEVVFRNISNGVVTHESTGLAAFTAQAKAAAALFSSRHQEITASKSVVDGGDPRLRVHLRFHPEQRPDQEEEQRDRPAHQPVSQPASQLSCAALCCAVQCCVVPHRVNERLSDTNHVIVGHSSHLSC